IRDFHVTGVQTLCSSDLAAAALMITALALQRVTDVLVKMSEFSWEEIAKSMVLLAGTLGIIAGALLLMPGTLPGAAALLVVSARSEERRVGKGCRSRVWQ